MDAPLITIGMPVHDGGAHLSEAIEAILAQTEQRFELLIADNASTDDTALIAARHAARDRRVRYHRHARNIGVVENFIFLAEHARSPFFCWAAHDDIHAPTSLATLLGLLQRSPDAGLAACAARNLAPDGVPGGVRPETRDMEALASANACQRVIAYLGQCPCAPIYGLFRTEVLRSQLDVLRAHRQAGGRSVFAGDIVFLAAFLGRHAMLASPEPLLHLRAGGMSHAIPRDWTATRCLGALRTFARRLKQVTESTAARRVDRWRLAHARRRAWTSIVFSAPVRRILWQSIERSLPALAPWRARCQIWTSAPMRRLRRRARALPSPARFVLFGAGKHTRRCLPAIEMALKPWATIIATWDDDPRAAPVRGDLQLVRATDLADLCFDHVLISTDTYEQQMHRRAWQVVGPAVDVWCLYDCALETHAAPPASEDVWGTIDAPRLIVDSAGQS